ncbi:hypothetical protein [Nocardia sp. NPDC004860]|uniref:hypothetical protein n=1 Tax=Nocardia sp. NPDC004860 TaxID=3154557 RepID=UPI0033AFDC0A
MTVFFERVQQLRLLFKPVGPATRTAYQPGELAHRGLWFPPADVLLGLGHVGHPPLMVGSAAIRGIWQRR